MEDYSKGVLLHVDDLSQQNMPTLEEFMEARRGAVGVAPVVALIELSPH